MMMKWRVVTDARRSLPRTLASCHLNPELLPPSIAWKWTKSCSCGEGSLGLHLNILLTVFAVCCVILREKRGCWSWGIDFRRNLPLNLWWSSNHPFHQDVTVWDKRSSKTVSETSDNLLELANLIYSRTIRLYARHVANHKFGERDFFLWGEGKEQIWGKLPLRLSVPTCLVYAVKCAAGIEEHLNYSFLRQLVDLSSE